MTKLVQTTVETGLEIAIIGMAGRFPGAKNVAEFWDNVRNGVESMSFFSDAELKSAGVNLELINHPNYIRSMGLLEDKEYFDSSFFGYTPGEAEIMDPQVRIFHESCWEALEDAGYEPGSYNRLIGLYAGASSSFEWEALCLLSGKVNALGPFAASLLKKDYLCTKTSYKLNLKGPSVFVQTACSTSLVAIHLACQGLLSGECDMALAGGVTITRHLKGGYIYQEGMIASPDGHCRAFDAKAGGTVGGEGIGVVVLKRLGEAIRDKDYIYAVIKGSAINNDGDRKVGFTAPSIRGQAEVIRAALQMAEVEPETISYIETHGTGTILGDPVELKALKKVLKTKEEHLCALGSVKTNVGHLDCAAGAAGFIKTVLALKHQLIPPSIHFETSNPEIDFESSPFYVNTGLSEWKQDGHPLRAGVSSFGIGGTNVHLVLEEAANTTVNYTSTADEKEYQLILLSARTLAALELVSQNLVNHLEKNPGISLADMAYTLQVGRKAFQYRRGLVCSDIDEVIRELSSPDSTKVKTFRAKDTCPVIFMFPGLGAHYVNMGLELYQKEPVFREEMDRCFKLLDSLEVHDVKEILYPAVEVGRTQPDINRFEIAQLVVFILEYALAKLLMTWSLKPHAMIGYSLGEYIAACVSGVFSLEDALNLIVFRGKLIKKMPPGIMLSVPISRDELIPLLTIHNELSLSIDNGPSCIVAGTDESIAVFEEEMKKKRYICMRLQASRAIHSKMMTPILKEFEDKVREISLNKPQIPYISNVTGGWITNEEAADPAYWSKHLRETVQFAAGIKELVKIENAIFVEIGPGRDLAALVGRFIGDNPGQQVMTLVRIPEKEVSDVYYLLNKIARLWLYGKRISWAEYYFKNNRHRIPLPPYPFERQYYWIDGNPFKMGTGFVNTNAQSEEIPDMADWFYLPSWKHSVLDPRRKRATSRKYIWLVFVNELDFGIRLLEQLKERGQDIVVVNMGDDFKQVESEKYPDICRDAYAINPAEKDHYDVLFNELRTREVMPDKIVHCWNVTEESDCPLDRESFDKAQYQGFFSLLYIVKALEKQKRSHDIDITLLSNQAQEVIGSESLYPQKAPAQGLLKSIPQEYPGVGCSSIDILLPRPGTAEEKVLIDSLIEEFTTDSGDTVIALRNNRRWVQVFDPLHLEESKKEYPGLRLKKQGIYLVTGGLGAIGLMFAELLVKRVGARLILTGRSDFPAVDEWEQWLTAHDASHPTSLKIKKLQGLQEMGGKILYYRADIADLEQMRMIISQTEETYGEINGVIHAAGIIEGDSVRPLRELSDDDCWLQFHAKVYGSMVLQELFKDKELDFCWLLSSISCVLGGLGFGAYASANLFMDVFVKKINRRKSPGSRWLSLDWDGMDAEKSKNSFERIFSLEDIDRLVVSNGGNLQERIDKWIKLESLRDEAYTDKEDLSTLKLSARPDLMTPYVEPRHPVEKSIAEIWQRLFGFEQIGVQDDFFELGGDSLKAITVISNIQKSLHVEVPISEFFKRVTIEKLAEYIDNAAEGTYSGIEPTEKKKYYELSSAQKRLYVLQQLDSESTTYNSTTVYILAGDPDKEKIDFVFRQLIMRHEALRTSFEMHDGRVLQRIHPGAVLKIIYNDSSINESVLDEKDVLQKGKSTELPNKININEILKNFIRPFDLSETPLLRVELTKLSEAKHVLLVDMHHIISDGVTHNILVSEFWILYRGKELPGLPLQYKDFSEWQNNQLESEEMKKQETFWLERFEGNIPVLNMPLDYVRPTVKSSEGDDIYFEIGKELTAKLKELNKETTVTLFMNLLAVYNVLLFKYSGNTDIVVGSPISGRNHADLGCILGIFLNMLAIRNYPTPEKSFLAFLKEVKENALLAYENQDYQFEELVRKLGLQGERSRNPIFDMGLVLQNTSDGGYFENETLAEDDTLKITPYVFENRVSRFDMLFDAFEIQNGENIKIRVEYSTRLFKPSSVELICKHFVEILRQVTEKREIKLKDVTISSRLQAAKSDQVNLDFEF